MEPQDWRQPDDVRRRTKKAKRRWSEGPVGTIRDAINEEEEGEDFFVKVDFDVVLWSPEFLQRKTVSVRKRRQGSSRRWLRRKRRGARPDGEKIRLN